MSGPDDGDDVAAGNTVTSTKLDPALLALRGSPPRAIRFRRNVIISLVALAAAGVAGTAYFALQPRHGLLDSPDEGNEVPVKAPDEALNRLPATYDAVPKLGPPLPGDLGRPILERQGQLANAPAVTPVQQQAAAIQDLSLKEEKTARESGLLVKADAVQALPAAATSGSALATVSSEDKIALDPDRDPNAQQRKSDFVRAGDKADDVNPHAVIPPASPYLLSAGSMIPASLITGLRSDLPGLVAAQITERIFDSATGHILLIPQGSRLVGNYDSVVAFGQRRALIVWQRIIYPDGSSLRLDNAPATDASGYAGLADRVDLHTWQLLERVALSTLLGVGAELQFSGESDLVQALRRSSQQNVSQAGSQITARTLQVQPTITVRPGARVRLMVHHDLILKPWLEN